MYDLYYLNDLEHYLPTCLATLRIHPHFSDKVHVFEADAFLQLCLGMNPEIPPKNGKSFA